MTLEGAGNPDQAGGAAYITKRNVQYCAGDERRKIARRSDMRERPQWETKEVRVAYLWRRFVHNLWWVDRTGLAAARSS
jgi:hypothetical protein